jgi:hypothetical protein
MCLSGINWSVHTNLRMKIIPKKKKKKRKKMMVMVMMK